MQSTSGTRKSSPRRHKKVLKGGIEGLNPSIRRIVDKLREQRDKRKSKESDINKLAAVRVAENVPVAMRDALAKDFENVISRTAVIMQNAKRKTVKPEDVNKATGKILSSEKKNLIMARAPFERYVRELFQDYADDVRLSEEAVFMLQAYYEELVQRMFLSAVEIMEAAGRKTVMASDVDRTRSLKKNICF